MAAFLALFPIVFGGLPIYAFVTGEPISINERMVTFEEQPLQFLPFFLVGLFMGVATFIFVAWMLTARYEIENGRVRHYTTFGKLRFDELLSSIEVIGEKNGSSEGSRKLLLKVNGSEEKVWTSIGNYVELKRILESGNHPPVNEPAPVSNEPLNPYYPPESIHTYRFRYLHFFSFIWCGFLLFALSGLFTGQFSNVENPWPMVAGMTPFIAIGVWMQMTGWIERVKLGPGGIEWRDWKGKIRCSASINEIVDYNYQPGEAPYLVVLTKQGEVRFSSYISKFQPLKLEIEKIVASRKR